LPLREEAEALLLSHWSGMACFDDRIRIVLHYLSGKIDVDLYLPSKCYETSTSARNLKSDYQKAIEGSDVFRTVQVWFG
ncbi:MAG: cation transporter, partial [Candidatus Thiodiazotropha sp. 6PDIVS]